MFAIGLLCNLLFRRDIVWDKSTKDVHCNTQKESRNDAFYATVQKETNGIRHSDIEYAKETRNDVVNYECISNESVGKGVFIGRLKESARQCMHL